MNRNDFNKCEIVQDLLPLYFDDACNPVSKELVKQHLSTCEACRKTYEELKNDTIDSVIKKSPQEFSQDMRKKKEMPHIKQEPLLHYY